MVTGAEEAAGAGVAGVYITGTAIIAGYYYWSQTPAGKRSLDGLRGAVYDGGAKAVENVKDTATAVGDWVSDVFSDDEDETQTQPVATSTTNDTTRRCDGPHRGRLQVQGYKKDVDPVQIELSWPWNRDCTPPLRSEGLTGLSNLLIETRMISRSSAGYRGAAFVKMSKFIKKSPPIGFTPLNSGGWSMLMKGIAVRNKTRGVPRNAPRVDLEIFEGRAFGDF